MKNPKRAGDAPIAIEIEAGKTYAWCSCGHSVNQPFCDGSHKGTDMNPKVLVAEKSGKQFFCTCKQTGSSPFCDGSHNKS